MYDAFVKLALGAVVAMTVACVSPQSDHADAQIDVQARAENKCVALATEKILGEVQSPSWRRKKWKIDLEMHELEGKLPELLIEIEPIDLSPGGGGRFSYDCNNNTLKLIEDFR